MNSKVSGDKCLACHTEPGKRVGDRKGYRASTDVRGKECIECHSEYNGKNFKLVRLETAKFDHNNTIFKLD